MKRVVNIAKNHKEAEQWDILQHITLTPEERQKIAMELKKRLYGDKIPLMRKKKMIRKDS